MARMVTTSGEEVLRNGTRRPKMGIPTTPSEPDHLARVNAKGRVYVLAHLVAQLSNCVNYSPLLFLPQTEICCYFCFNFFSL